MESYQRKCPKQQRTAALLSQLLDWSTRWVLKYQPPCADAKMNTYHFHCTGLAAPCSLYLLALQILPDSALPCSYLLSTVKLTWLQLHLPFYFSFPSSCLIHLMHLTYPTPGFYLYHRPGFSNCAPEPSGSHKAADTAVSSSPWAGSSSASPSCLSKKRLITGSKYLG